MKRKDLFTKNNTIAREYDLFSLAVPHHDEFQKEVGNQISSTFKNTSPVNVIEIGCGTGITSKEILVALPEGNITSIDMEGVMLDQARQKEELNQIVFIHEGALSFLARQKDNSVECVVSAYTLHNLSKDVRADIVSEIYRVLRNDGIFINADKYGYDDIDFHRNIFEQQMESFSLFEKSEYPELAKEWRSHYIKDNSEKLLFTEQEIVNLSKKIGFKNIELVYRQMLEGIYVLKK